MLNHVDRDLHNAIHEEMLKEDPSEIFKDRVYVFDRFEEKYGEIYGNVLDVGAGNGYASIWLAKNCPKVKKIIALEASEIAVSKLIPKNTKYHNVEGKVIPRFGSFDDLESEEFDFVIALGALHHSKNLKLTFTCISKLIASGGYFIAQEPSMPDTTTHDEYHYKYNIVEERYGMNIRNGDRHDHFFRECEYLAAAVLSGFDIILNEKWLNNNRINYIFMFANKLKKYLKHYRKYGAKSILSKLLIKNSIKNSSNWKNELQYAVRNLSPRLLVFRKSSRSEIYHSWDSDES